MSMETEKQIAEMHEKIGILFDRLYGTNGHTGDIAELKDGVKTALDQCERNRLDVAKLKAGILGAIAAASGGLASGLAAIFGK